MKFSKILSLGVAVVFLTAASGAMAAGDVTKGHKLANKCKACHTLKKGKKNKLGPNLYGIIGAKAASVEKYKYSKAMANSGIIWNGAAFTEFLTKPKKFVKGTKMSFPGIRKPDQRADLLAYFETLTDETIVHVAVGDIVAGEKAANKYCVVCHSVNKGGKTVFGPNLFDIAGKPAGAIEGFRYSKALKNSGISWTDANLIEFMANPNQFVEGTTAQFGGIKSAKDREDILAYIKTLK